MTKSKKFRAGFTLIELLVVISIISLLSSIVMASLSVARTRAQDSKRISGLIQVRNAIELYASENHNPLYVSTNSTWACFIPSGPCPINNTYTWSYGSYYLQTQLVAVSTPSIEIVPRAYAALPGPPKNSWWYISDGKDYELVSLGFQNQGSIPASMRDDAANFGFQLASCNYAAATASNPAKNDWPAPPNWACI